MGNLSAEAKAPAALLVLQLKRSAFNSVSVGNRYPLGQGLFTPLTPCHKLVFCGLRQSLGEVDVKIKLPCAGWSVELKVEVVAEFLH
jgi:hypothetical protein